MFRNPRQNANRDPSKYIPPALGRPPSPPPSPDDREAPTEQLSHDKQKPQIKMAATATNLPTIGRASTTSRKGRIGSNNPAKGKPNGNILAFFKKAEDENGELFVRSRGQSSISTTAASQTNKTAVAAESGGGTSRYQEHGGAVKRRRLSGPDSTSLDTMTTTINAVANQDAEKVAKDTSAGPRILAKSKGPFLEEESDAEEMADAAVDRASDFPVQHGNPVTSSPTQIDGLNRPNTCRDQTSDGVGSVPPEPAYLEQEETLIVPNSDFPDFENLGDFDEDVFEEGDEFVEKTWMEEQARIEAELEQAEGDDAFQMTKDTAGVSAECSELTDAPACPVCNTSLAGISDQEAGVHVNHCLDGNPTPLPQPAKDVHKGVAPKAADRFRKTPRAPKPGQASPFVLGEKTSSGGSAFSKLMSGHAEDAAWADAAASERESRGKPSYQRTCPFYKILPGFNICVDAFRYGAVEGCRAYFLSHFHSDHYIGLTSHWCHGPIFCSKVTANLVKQQLRVDPQFVIALDWETKLEVPGSNGVHVTMISANHCPGSSLYLFEKVVGRAPNPKTQRVLHCGDFRACRMHVEHPLLRPDVQDAVGGKKRDQKIDVCYLDTTYLNPKYAFPSQEAVITACADMCVSLSKVRADASDGWETMKRERAGAGMVKFVKRESEDLVIKQEEEIEEKPDLDAMAVLKKANEKHRGRLLVVVGTYSIGKERICLGIARALNSKIYAPAGKQRIVRALEEPELSALMTNDPTEAQVHMTPLFEIRAETLDDYLKDYKDHFSRAVGFRPSGWNYRPPNSRFTESPNVGTVLHSDNWKSAYSMKDLVPQRGSTSRASCFGVPYSEHSSFRELTMFCCALRIDKIIPTVNIGSAKSREKMAGWCKKWADERKKNGLFRLKQDDEW